MGKSIGMQQPLLFNSRHSLKPQIPSLKVNAKITSKLVLTLDSPGRGGGKKQGVVVQE